MLFIGKYYAENNYKISVNMHFIEMSSAFHRKNISLNLFL